MTYKFQLPTKSSRENVEKDFNSVDSEERKPKMTFLRSAGF